MCAASMRSYCVALILAVSAGLGMARECRAGVVYLALGDSTTFGIDPSTPGSLVPSYADQGFVRPLADTLAIANRGIRPTVLNLGVSGELSTTFFSGQAPPGYTTYPELNLNYPVPAISQDALMTSSIRAIHAAGNSVGYVSFLIGANDIFYLVGTPAFQNASDADKRAMIAATLGAVQSNYVKVLTELRSLAPEARIILPDYYNPFPSSDPNHAFYSSILAAFNPAVQADAAAFGAVFVDIAPLFAGRELQLTNIASGDVHPTQAGYALIAGAISQAVVPEPSSFAMLAIGVVGLAVRARRRA